jgi:hypothetical protein
MIEGLVRMLWTDLVSISELIDESEMRQHRDPVAITWGRLAKVAEESGEVIAAYIGVIGQNPRKGRTHTDDDVKRELLDVALTALAAYEHMDGHRYNAIIDLGEHTRVTLARLKGGSHDA